MIRSKKAGEFFQEGARQELIDGAKKFTWIYKNNVGVVVSKQVKMKFQELVRNKAFYQGLLR